MKTPELKGQSEQNETKLLENGWTLSEQQEYVRQVLEGESEGSWLYSWDYKDRAGKENGTHLFLHAVHHKDYTDKFFSAEEKLYERNSFHVKKVLEGVQKIINIGPGDGKKAVTYLKKLPGYQRLLEDKTYISADISEKSRKIANHYVEQQLGMKTDEIAGDWLLTHLLEEVKNKAFLFEGCSIGQFSNEGAVRLLKNLGSDSSTKGRDLIMNYFLAPDRRQYDYQERVDALVESYSNPAVEKWIMRSFEELGCDTSKLQFCVKYEKSRSDSPAMVRVGAKVKEGESLHIGGEILPSGKELWAISSKRYTHEEMKELLEAAGFDISFRDAEDDVAMVIARNKPKSAVIQHLQKHRKKYKHLLIGALTALNIGMGAVRAHQVQQEEEKKETIEKYKERKYSPSEMGGHGNYTAEFLASHKENVENRIVNTMEEQYDLSELTDEQKSIVKSLLLSEIDKNTMVISTWHTGAGHAPKKYRQYVRDFVTTHQEFFVRAGIPVPKYAFSKLRPYKDVLYATYQLSSDKAGKIDEQIKKKNVDTKELVRYGDDKTGFEEMGGIISVDGKEYFATTVPIVNEGGNAGEWSVQHGKGELDDILGWGYITTLVKQLLEKCENEFEGTINSQSPYLQEEIKEYLIEKGKNSDFDWLLTSEVRQTYFIFTYIYPDLQEKYKLVPKDNGHGSEKYDIREDIENITSCFESEHINVSTSCADLVVRLLIQQYAAETDNVQRRIATKAEGMNWLIANAEQLQEEGALIDVRGIPLDKLHEVRSAAEKTLEKELGEISNWEKGLVGMKFTLNDSQGGEYRFSFSQKDGGTPYLVAVPVNEQAKSYLKKMESQVLKEIGDPARKRFSEELYGKPYSKLSSGEKKYVDIKLRSKLGTYDSIQWLHSLRSREVAKKIKEVCKEAGIREGT